MRSHGFTLIELSIVLVIIGLMVGAVVGGKALIHQAELRKLIGDMLSYETAFNSYIMQYDAIPGDHKTALEYWPAKTSNGNGDGIIVTEDDVTNPVNEDVVAWQHLVLAELVSFHYFTSTSPTIIGGNLPKGVFKNSGYRFHSWPYEVPCLANPDGDPSCSPSIWGKRGVQLLSASMDGGYQYGPILTPARAKTVDLKMDDGIPIKGKLVADGETPDIAGCILGRTAWGDPGNGVYNVANQDVACLLQYFVR